MCHFVFANFWRFDEYKFLNIVNIWCIPLQALFGHLFEFHFCNIWKDFKLPSMSKLGLKFTHSEVSFGMKLCIQSWSFKNSMDPQLLCIYSKLLPQSLIFIYSSFNWGHFFEFPFASFEIFLGVGTENELLFALNYSASVMWLLKLIIHWAFAKFQGKW